MATKTIENMHFYVPITTYTYDNCEFHTLRVSVRYCKGRGFRASFTPGWGDNYGWGCVIDGSNNPLTAGMTVDVVPAEKNNSKRIAEMTESLKLAKDIIAALFDDREWQKLKGVLQNVARFGYTEGFKEQAEKYLAERVSNEKAIKPTEPVVKQVDVMGLMGALQTTGKAKLSDFATPIEIESSNTNNSNSAIMEKNFKAADLIGKEIIIGGTAAKYVVNSVDGDKLTCDFVNDGMTIPMSVSIAQVQKFIADGKWTIADDNQAATTDVQTEADVAEVDDIVPVVKPKAKVQEEPVAVADDNEPDPDAVGELVFEEPTKAKVDPIKPIKPKAKGKSTQKAQKEPTAKYAYATYTTKKGKTGAKITGFASEDDVFYAMAAEIHASGSYERDKQGNKHYYLCFGPRYAEAAKSICKVLNSDKTVNQKVEVCKLIVSQATEERVQKREEWKAKREERRNQTSAVSPQTSTEKTYTQSELAEWLRKLNAGDPKAAKFFNDLAKAA